METTNFCKKDEINCGNNCNEIQECQTTKTLGEGAQGKVFVCDKDYVVKKVNNFKDLAQEVKYARSEKTDKYKHVAKIFLPTDNENKIICDGTHIGMEKVFTLDDFLKTNLISTNNDEQKQQKQINLKVRLIKMLQIALQVLHKQVKFSHNDLKLQNIGIKKENDSWVIKFIDMGTCHEINEAEKGYFDFNDNKYPYLEVYTPHYVSPLTLYYKQHNIDRDNWAFGCIIYNIITSRVENEQLLFDHIIDANNEFALLYNIPKIGLKELSFMLSRTDEDEKKGEMITDEMITAKERFNAVLEINPEFSKNIREYIYNLMYPSLLEVVYQRQPDIFNKTDIEQIKQADIKQIEEQIEEKDIEQINKDNKEQNTTSKKDVSIKLTFTGIEKMKNNIQKLVQTIETMNMKDFIDIKRNLFLLKLF